MGHWQTTGHVECACGERAEVQVISAPALDLALDDGGPLWKVDCDPCTRCVIGRSEGEVRAGFAAMALHSRHQTRVAT